MDILYANFNIQNYEINKKTTREISITTTLQYYYNTNIIMSSNRI